MSGPLGAVALFAVCAAVLLANLRWRFDVNVPPRYTPRITNKATYPKVYVHGITGFAAALACLVLGVPVIPVAAILGAASVAWEYTQGGTVDPYDIGAALLGIAVACLLILGYCYCR